MTKKELVRFLKENFRNGRGEIDLSELDFGEVNVNLSMIKAREIINAQQEAGRILNSHQKAKFDIYNDHQESEDISNYSQIAEHNIFNYNQEAYSSIDNEEQSAEEINNTKQDAKKIFN